MAVVFKIALVIACYFIGNISPSIIIGKYVAGIDIREHGSGNAGTTNVLRTLGKKAAAATLAIDILKGVAAVLIGKSVGTEMGMICGLAAFIGHIWPVLYGFRGGKGVATGLGVMAATLPLMALICGGIGIALIAAARWVSLGALVAACILPAAVYFCEPSYFAWSLSFAAIVFYTHRKNIRRLLAGEEPKISFKKAEKMGQETGDRKQ